MRNFHQLTIWQKSHQLTLKIYFLTLKFPREETYNLVSQMRRSSSSIPTNIAEGCGRNSDAEMKRFLTISSGSVSELEYQLLLSKELKYISDSVYEDLVGSTIEIRKIIYSFIKSLS